MKNNSCYVLVVVEVKERGSKIKLSDIIVGTQQPNRASLVSMHVTNSRYCKIP
jgi:hypothetical protein